MRLIHYGGAMSLDGYIATLNGAYNWIIQDSDMDFPAMMARYDTFLIGRKTFDAMGHSLKMMPADSKTIVFSRTLDPARHLGIRISDDPPGILRELHGKPGKDIALFGGGDLFRSLLAAELVDRVEVSLIPVLLGEGIPFLPPPAPLTRLKLVNQRVYEKTGIISIEYEVLRA